MLSISCNLSFLKMICHGFTTLRYPKTPARQTTFAYPDQDRRDNYF